MKLDHICIRVKNLEESIIFYKQAFDCTEEKIQDFPEYGFTLVFLSFPNSEVTLELTYNHDYQEYELGNGYGHIGMKVKKIQDLYKKHQSLGIKLTEIKNFGGASDYYFVTDPDGYKIEIIAE